MSGKAKRLIVMAGGTGGHIFPGLAVTNYLLEEGWQVRWLGTAEHMEASLVPNHGIEIDFISISGLLGKKRQAQLRTLLCIWKAVRQAQLIIRRFQPDVVLGMGGYVSGPGGLAAWLEGIPVVLHEQNRIPGLTNRCLAYIAKTVLQAFPDTFPNAKVVGNPLHQDILALPPPFERSKGRKGPLRILVIGGSQGAQVLNKMLPEIASRLGDKIRLFHQVGKGWLDKVLRDYDRSGKIHHHKVTEFIEDMASAYAWADLVVSRSGALTVSEVAASGVAAIFVPFEHKDRQQYWNARLLEESGAAKIIEQKDFNVDMMSILLANLQRPMLLTMAEKARSVAIFNATERVAIELTKAAK